MISSNVENMSTIAKNGNHNLKNHNPKKTKTNIEGATNEIIEKEKEN